MKPEIWALLTALCWGGGSLLEKRGVKIGHLAPAVGTTIRTVFSLAMLLALSLPLWGQLKLPLWAQIKTAGTKSILLIALGGGVLAGGVGIICLYTALKHGHLATVLVIAFCLAPVIGAVLGRLFLHETLSLLQFLGIALCVVGAAMTIYFAKH